MDISPEYIKMCDTPPIQNPWKLKKTHVERCADLDLYFSPSPSLAALDENRGGIAYISGPTFLDGR